jgi:acyl-CoA thioesterase
MQRAPEWEFDRAVAIRPAEAPGVFTGQIADGWDIGGNANGGYVLAMAVNAMRAASGRPDPITVTAHFLAPVAPGPVEIHTEIAKTGKRLVTVAGAMRREGRELLRMLGAFGDASAGAAMPSQLHGAPPELPPPHECVARSIVGGAVEVPLANRLQMLLHPDDAGVQADQPTGEGVVRGSFQFTDGREVDTLALVLACDSFPPSIFNLRDVPRGWVPTVELTVHVRGVPSPGPLRGRFQTRFVSGGAMEEDGQIWDSDDQLVALSRQYALVANPAA